MKNLIRSISIAVFSLMFVVSSSFAQEKTEEHSSHQHHSVDKITSSPKAVIHPMEYDFGEIIQDSIITTDFVISNKGSDILQIKKVDASCGCTAAVAGKKELKPGESTNINVKFNSKGKTGKQKKYVYVETNDPNNSTIRLTLTGNIIQKEISTATKN